ncbi:MAG TPA: ABC transporter substrate-binding protein, partial [Acidimicrobiia bacterium]|nr:ABC transporter substrate-binding protein [Acidimicrobiia bacterium]
MNGAKPLGLKLLACLAVIAMFVAACSEDSVDDETTTTDDDVTTPAPPDEGDDERVAGFDTYTLGIFQDVATDNPWSYLDSSGNDVWVGYVLGPTLGQPYDIKLPGLEVVPDLAAGELEPVVQEGGNWVGTIKLRDDIVWSDGAAITAQDYVFTYETARDFALTAQWPDYLDAATEGTQGVTGVEAIDDQTVEVTFNTAPGLAVWGVGKGPPYMPILPEHFWGPVVAEAAATETPRNTLIAASGVGAPSAGPTVFGEIQEGGFAATTANANYTHAGATVESGGVTYQVGPFATNFHYKVFSGQEVAVLALANGEVDLLLNPLGMQHGLIDQVSSSEDLTTVVNRTNGYRFLAFNHSRAPMDDPAFRDALTAMINKEFVTENLLPGAAFPLYVLLPERNEAWYNEEVAEELAEAGFAGLDDDTRRSIAISLLIGAGYTWPEGEAPGWYANTDDDPETPDEYSPEPVDGFSFTAAAGGIVSPAGEAIQPLELIHPNAGHDPLRAAFGGYVAGVAREIGIPVSSVPSDF